MKKTLWFLVFHLAMGITLYSQNTSYDATAGNAGSRNSSFGYSAGSSVTGTDNLFVGYVAGRYTTTGNYNAYWGYCSGDYNQTGSMNTYIGSRAGRYGNSSIHNVAIGYSAGYNSTASRNVLVGKSALYSNDTGEKNVSIGSTSGYGSSGDYNVFLGYRAGYNETGSNKLYIENDSSSAPLIYGEFDNDIVTIHGNLGVGMTDVPDSISLLVDSLIIAKEVVIILESFPDYVFDESYALIPLRELELKINELGHLPGLLSREEVIEQGIDTGVLSTQLLEKVEELTLYLIELNSELDKEGAHQQELISLLTDLKRKSSESKNR